MGDELEVVGRAAHAGGAIELCTEQVPDVVVVDPRLPDVDAGRALITELRARFPDTIVLVLSWPGRDDEHAAMRALADGFVPKSDAPPELVRRIVELAGHALERSPSGGRGTIEC